MRILIISLHGKAEIKDTEILPRVGDKVDLFYVPYPTVTNVLLYPSIDTQKKLLGNVNGIALLDAIVTVE